MRSIFAVHSPAMLKRPVAALALFALVAVAQQTAAPDPLAGEVKDGVYTNAFFGLSIEIPKKWDNSVTPDLTRLPKEQRAEYATMNEQIRRQQHELIEAHPPLFYVNIAELRLLFVQKNGTGQYVAGPPTLYPFEEAWSLRAQPAAGDGVALRDLVIQHLKEGSKDARVAEDPVLIDRVAFTRMDRKLTTARGTSYYMTSLLGIRNGQLLELDFGAKGRKKLDELMAATLPTIHFAALPGK